MRRSVAPAVLGLAFLTFSCGDDGPATPPTETPLPSADVEIVVDDRGIPHIYAQNDEDLFFAYGYQLASDRMLQLEMFRRYAHGELSAVLGADGPGSFRGDALTDDTFAKVFNWRDWGKEDAAWMKANDPEQYKLTSAWARGINKRVEEIASGEAPVPYGFGPDALDFMPSAWSAEDVYVVQKMVGFGLDQTILYEVLITFIETLHPEALEAIQLFKPARQTFALPPEDRPELVTASLGEPAREPLVGPPMQPIELPSLGNLGRIQHSKALGSNNWAVDGRFTDNGMPMVAGDPHLGYSFGGIMYALHLNSLDAGGTYDNVGFAFVAVPGMFAGHNRSLAYTPTSAFADVMDMWAVEIVDDVAMVGGEAVPVVHRKESIAVKGGDAVELDVIDVPGYGVILDHQIVGSPIPFVDKGLHALVGWTGYRARPARYFRPLMKATNLDEFEAAVDAMPEMTYNFVGADKTGIAYRVGVEIPARSKPAPGRQPWAVMDASDPEALWPAGEFLTPDQKPHSRATEQGFVVTANNDPFGFTGNGRLDDDPWYYGSVFVPGWRAHRIESELGRLTTEGPITREDMQSLQIDVHSGLADDLVPVITAAHAQIGVDPALAEWEGRTDIDELVTLLTVDWNRKMARDEAGALAFHAFSHLVTGEVMKGNINSLIYSQVLDAAPMYVLKIAMLTLTDQFPNGAAALEDGKNVVVVRALAETADFLTARFGGVSAANYSYADMRVSSMDHAFGRDFDLVDIPTDGGEDTVNVAQSKFLDADGEIAEQWVSHWGPIERQVMVFGEDGIPASYANFPMGNVADPSGPHFDDELDGWVEGSYEKLLYGRDEILAAKESSYVLPAAKQP